MLELDESEKVLQERKSMIAPRLSEGSKKPVVDRKSIASLKRGSTFLNMVSPKSGSIKNKEELNNYLATHGY